MSRKMLASVRGMQLSARGGKIYWVVGTASFMFLLVSLGFFFVAKF